MDGHEILVGIDFGTTYSGVSWAINSGVQRIHLVTDWPNGKNRIEQSEKVPSLVSIDPVYPQKRKWGFEADKKHSPAWFKLWLNADLHRTGPLGSFVMGFTNSGSSDLSRNAHQATVDYLRCLWSYAKAHISRQVGSYLIKPRLVLTVPAMWSSSVTERLRMAAIEAGLPEDFHVISEPEAALHHLIHEERHLQTPEFAKGDIYTICDAGGANVNVITYKILSVKPLVVSEYIPPQDWMPGALCGATFIDMHFEEYVKTKVGEEEYSMIGDSSKAQMMHDFERSLKRGFRGDLRGNAEIRLDVVEDKGIRSERVEITEDSLRAIFDPVCSEVARLIEEQIRAVRERRKQVKKVILVGGFGANSYLRRVISSRVQVRVVQAIDAWSSVCRGATSWLLGCLEQDPTGTLPSQTIRPVTARIARYSYGITQVQDRRRTFYGEKSMKAGRSAAGVDRPGTEKMLWLVRRGDAIAPGFQKQHEIHEEIQITTRWYHIFLSPNRAYTRELRVFYSERDSAPETFDAETVLEFCTVSYTVKLARLRRAMYRVWRAASGKYNVALSLTMKVGPEHVTFIVSCDGLEVGRRQVRWEPGEGRNRLLDGNAGSSPVANSSSPVREKSPGTRVVTSKIELRRQDSLYLRLGDSAVGLQDL